MIPFWLVVTIQVAPVVAVIGVMVYILWMMGAFYRGASEPFIPNDDSWYLVPSYAMDEWLGRRWRAFWEGVN